MIASERGEVGLPAGIGLLRAGGSAMDAVEAAIRVVEANEADHYVGVGGLPNLLGEVELDASIIGRRHPPGRGGGRGHRVPAPDLDRPGRGRAAAQHVLLVGAGAERFADEAGIERGETLTDEARQMWRDGLDPAALDEIERSAARARPPTGARR